MTFTTCSRKEHRTITDKIRRLLSVAALVVGALLSAAVPAGAQVNTDQVVSIGRNAMYFEDYVLAIQYFNQAIKAKPYLARPYLYRAVAKFNLDDYRGAETDATLALERNPYITDAWEVRGVARQRRGDNRGAVADYKEALRLLPHNRQITFNLASAQTEAGMYDSADSTYNDLLNAYPRFENALLGRARLRLAQKDTVSARQDIDRALQIDHNLFNAHAMLADIAMRGRRTEDVDSALTHLDAAIKLQPHYSGLYVNRAYLKYRKDDWYGAMADYDYAIQMDPVNSMARFNRGLLEMEASAYDRALEDFSQVLRLNPDDIRARYNRAVIYAQKHDYKNAIGDIDHVIEAYPKFPTGYLMRSEFNRALGNVKPAMADFDKGRALQRNLRADQLPDSNMVRGGMAPVITPAVTDGDRADAGHNSDTRVSEAERQLAQRQFAALLTVADNTDFRDEFNNDAIRGRIQDRNIHIEVEPMVELTYYASPTEVRPNTFYIKEVDDVNGLRALPMTIVVTTHAPQLTIESLIDKHFKSIAYYDSYLATHTPRAIDYFGRAMDLLTVHNYQAAVADLDRALKLTPDFAPAAMLRAQAHWRMLQSSQAGLNEEDGSTSGTTPGNRSVREQSLAEAILADLDKVLQVSPRNAFAWYNRGNLLLERGDMQGAREAYDKALEIKPDFAEAYFNRGYVNLSAGNRRQGIADLGRAGELGIVNAYNLMKRIDNMQ